MRAIWIWYLPLVAALVAAVQGGCGGPSAEDTFVVAHPCGRDQLHRSPVHAAVKGTWTRIEGCGSTALVRNEVAGEHETCRISEHQVLGTPPGDFDPDAGPTALVPCPSGTVCRRHDPPCCGGMAATATWTCVDPDADTRPVIEP